MKKVINYKLLSIFVLFTIICLFVMCKPVIPEENNNPDEPDRIDEVDEYTTIYDYTTLNSELTVEFSNLEEGDRILILPLNSSASRDNVTLYDTFDLNVEYTGGSPKNVKPLRPEASYEQIDKKLDLNKEYFKDYIFEEEDKSFYSILTKNQSKAESKQPKSHSLNDIVNFWVLDDLASSTCKDVECSSTLLYIGTHCYIFFSNDLAENPKATELAQKLGEAFDNNIYDKETSYFGYEFGGDPNISSEYGGIDKDPKIFVLVESITKNCGGYFSSTNEYPDSITQTWSPSRRSNEKEMIYVIMSNDLINSNLVPIDTLAHEYHHLIQWTKFYKRLRKDQWSIFTEGFANLAATICGYGPKINNFNWIESFSLASFTASITEPYYSHVYKTSACYAFAEYALRKFGWNFINYLYNSDDVGVAGIEDSLNKIGYNYGYSTLVLDILTSLYLGKYQFSYPPANLYDHDTGININSTNKCWYGYGPSFINGLLKGLKTKFYNSYPQNLSIKLYNYGSDPLEFASGSNGKITFIFTNISKNTIIRIILLKVNAREDPCIDGKLTDWENKNYVEGIDPESDNGADNSSVDIIKYRAFIQNNILYAVLITKAKPETSSSLGVYNIYLDITGDNICDYVITFLDDKLTIYKYENGQYIEDKTIFLNNVKYFANEVVEMKIDLNQFNLPLKNSIGIKFWSYCYKNSIFYPDYTDIMTITR